MESLRPRTDENTLSFWRENYFSDSGKVNLGACACVCVSLLVSVYSVPVTMEKDKPLSNISDFDP